MKKTNKKIYTSMLLAVLLLITGIIPTYAVDISSYEAVDENDYSTTEEKIITEASIDDDFVDNSVLVMLNNQTSLELNDFTADDFSNIGAVDVNDLTSYTIDNIKELCIENGAYEVISSDSEAKSVTSSQNDNIQGNIIYEPDEEIVEEFSDFHQMIEITLDTNSKQNVLDVIDELQQKDYVIAAEPNYILTLDSSTVTANDTYASDQWAIDTIDLPSAWAITTGSSDVSVGVVDSGIKAAHSDLTANVDTTLSKSFIDDSPLTDENGHGTHVAGIIGAVGNNNQGVSGVCWDVNLVSLKVLDSTGDGNIADVIDAINYAESCDIKLLNLSVGFCVTSNDYRHNGTIFQEAIESFDGLLVCAAGNKYINIDDPINSTMIDYPGAYSGDNMITVAASTQNDNLWYNATYKGSNYGTDSVDLAAPGYEIYSTYNSSSSSEYYVNMTGTSMAAPQVTGVAALIWSKYPDLTVSEVKDAILNNVDEVDALSDKVKTGGRLNAFKALSSLITLGDVNLDGMITVTDVTLVQKYIVGSATLSVEQQIAADVNKDGIIDSTDASLIQKMFM